MILYVRNYGKQLRRANKYVGEKYSINLDLAATTIAFEQEFNCKIIMHDEIEDRGVEFESAAAATMFLLKWS